MYGIVASDSVKKLKIDCSITERELMKKAAGLIILAIGLASCVSNGSAARNAEKSWDSFAEPTFPYLAFDDLSQNADFHSIIDGTFVKSEPDGNGNLRLILDCGFSYYLTQEITQSRYELVLGGFGSVTAKPGEIQEGDVLGSVRGLPYASARSADLEPWMIRSGSVPVFFEGYWWYYPAWLNPQKTQWLSFRPVDSLSAAVKDFYQRWASEENPAVGSTIHYFPNLDRIRTRIRLESYPVPVEPNDALSVTERKLYGRTGLFAFQNFIEQEGDYDIMLYWQQGFDRYLREEYRLGTDLWVYCSIFTLDHERKLIIVCARDFALKSDEEILSERELKARQSLR